ncbi:VOC family protein [Aeromicrobium sp. Sec7.5]|uniref:VOC family protein n=1 Tax=Aeromicrobium sp. Sec7.5 TaxID=3121276 RepID=UPI002FE49428
MRRPIPTTRCPHHETKSSDMGHIGSMVTFHWPFSGFSVDDVGEAVAELAARGVEFLRYDGAPQDEHGVMRGYGPDIAWFTDPSGNVFSVIAR